MKNEVSNTTDTARFSCKTSDLRESLKFLSNAVPKNARGRNYQCEITVKQNEVQFRVIGALHTIYCKSSGPVKVTITFYGFNKIIGSMDNKTTEFVITDNILSIGNLSIRADTCFFEDDKILRSINLPINYSVSDILKLKLKYTPEELTFNKLNSLYEKIYQTMINDIDQVSRKLIKYGFTHKEIEQMVLQRVYGITCNYE